MRIAIAADHAGFELKELLRSALSVKGHEVHDLGTCGPAPVDYPDYARALGEAVVAGTAERGILLCGSGVGASVAANKVRGVRAGLCHDVFLAEIARANNDTNVLVMGAKVVAADLAEEIAAIWLTTPFKGGRHQRRLDMIAALERGEPLI